MQLDQLLSSTRLLSAPANSDDATLAEPGEDPQLSFEQYARSWEEDEALGLCQVTDLDMEQCNGADDDCDGEVDEGFSDIDIDGTPDCMDDDELTGTDVGADRGTEPEG